MLSEGKFRPIFCWGDLRRWAYGIHLYPRLFYQAHWALTESIGGSWEAGCASWDGADRLSSAPARATGVRGTPWGVHPKSQKNNEEPELSWESSPPWGRTEGFQDWQGPGTWEEKYINPSQRTVRASEASERSYKPSFKHEVQHHIIRRNQAHEDTKWDGKLRAGTPSWGICGAQRLEFKIAIFNVSTFTVPEETKEGEPQQKPAKGGQWKFWKWKIQS